MNNTWETKLQRFWLIISAVSLLMPLILLATSATDEVFKNIMTITVGVVFVFTFPTSLFALPFLAMFRFVLEMETDSIFASYLYLGILNIIGFVQWFRIMPAFYGTSKPMSLPTIFES
ncbi:MAG: hypothetical protein AAB336_08570 [Acidobacteriota bacterium]